MMPMHFSVIGGGGGGPAGPVAAAFGVGTGTGTCIGTGCGGGAFGLNRNRLRSVDDGFGRSADNASRWTSGAPDAASAFFCAFAVGVPADVTPPPLAALAGGVVCLDVVAAGADAGRPGPASGLARTTPGGPGRT